MKITKNKKAPLIGISGTLITIESGSYIGLERTAVVHNYIEVVEAVGGVPLVLPILENKVLIEQQIHHLDGLILSGGYDVTPLFYGEEPLKGLEAICPRRDEHELELIRLACYHGKPIFGICRGLQLLNVAFGGTLFQDINLAIPAVLQHYSKGKPEDPAHSVTILPRTLLSHTMIENTILTNSLHHQAIKTLGSGLRVNAKTKDDIIEGIEGITDHFILGVQWHPELMVKKHPNMLKLFHAFVEACRNNQKTELRRQESGDGSRESGDRSQKTFDTFLNS